MDNLFQGNCTEGIGGSQPNPGHTTPILSLEGLVDLLAALELELSKLPEPLPLFSRELVDGIAASLAVKE